MFRRWLLALIARFGLIGVGFCCCLLLLYLLACKPASNSKKPSLPWPEGTTSKEGYMALLQEREDSHRHYINSLTKQIAELKEALQERTQQLQESLDKAKAKGILPQDAEMNVVLKSWCVFCLLQFFVNEIFACLRVYQLETGLSKHPAERPVRKDRKDELISTVETALHILNGPQQHQEDTRRNCCLWVAGLTRTERTRGSTYELVFKGDSPQDFTQLLLFRPFGPPMKVKSESVNTRSTVINIIIPLSKRMEAFSRFMSNFRYCLNSKVHLTVVYFGKDEVDQVKTVTVRKFRSFTLIQLNEVFSRGRGLEVGVRAWRRRQNVLLFFCDVDIVFTADFLTSCRINAEPGKKVFYPVLFSQYNPAVIYRNSTHSPPLQQQLVISQETGFWRDFGFGMTCQYRSDFINIGGFDRSIKGWGLEDVHLYRKYLHSKLMVIRSPSRGLFHLWHEKSCADELPPDKFKMCMQTKAMNEASHGQLGELYFRREKGPHRNR
uniref:Hexosyltransferase n=1 Tax=Oryzias latipes TaxID=8090 RepID=A0A3P9K1G8_ORYLA